jgi:GGDEF domain-containing protein
VIVYTSQVISAVAGERDPGAFVGHVGGDDFVVLCDPAVAEPICQGIIERFDAGVARLYDAVDAERGYVEVENRQKQMHRYSLLSISIGVAVARPNTIDDPRRLAEVASEMKSYAKSQDGSVYAIDRRNAERATSS